MKLNEILTISGHSGLFKLIAQGKNNIIVESLVDGKRMPAFSTDRLNSLSDIALFTTGEELPLKDVFHRMYEAFDHKEVELNFKKQTKEMIALFEKAIPEYDKNRVYTSDIKKIMTWYNILIKNNLLPFEEELKEDVKEEKTDNADLAIETKTEEKKSVKKTTKKKTTTAKNE
ncbi:MAG: DUF5606 domain-containing protein [Bacteroidales bacterium]|nr:DUF5606 domain-containing protein [Bacteroidales bacterium]